MKNPCMNCKTIWLCGVYGGSCRKRDLFELLKRFTKKTVSEEEEVWCEIRRLSDLRSRYSIFDEEEIVKYKACSTAISALRTIVDKDWRAAMYRDVCKDCGYLDWQPWILQGCGFVLAPPVVGRDFEPSQVLDKCDDKETRNEEK